jgi:hypothetical protein
MTEETDRYVFTKHDAYKLEPGQQGEPAEQVLGEDNARRLGLTGATVYTLPGGRRVIARKS